MNNIAFKFYRTKKNNILIVHSFKNGQILFYDDISAKLLHNLLLNDSKTLSKLLSENNISVIDWNEFVDDFHLQIEQEAHQYETISNEFNHSEKEVYEELYQAGFLYSFHLDLTKKCNFRCNHCYHTFESYDQNDLSLDEIKILFETLEKIGVFKLVLSGGEPLLRQDIWDILELGKQHNFLIEIYSNGYLIDDNTVIKLKQYPVALLSFSYYGDEASTTKVTNNSLAHARLMNAAELCKANNIVFEFKYTILKENIDSIAYAREFCKTHSIPLSFELCITPKLNGSTDNLRSKITEEEYIRVFSEHKDIMLYPPVKNNETDEVQCSAAKYSLYCDYSGEIFPCVSWRTSLGHISDLERIWKELWEKNHLIQKKCSAFPSFNKFSFCEYCYQICPGLSCLEKNNDGDCYNAGCEIAKIVERIYNQNK